MNVSLLKTCTFISVYLLCFRYVVPELLVTLSRALLGRSQAAIEMSDLGVVDRDLASCLEISCHVLHVDARCYAEANLQVN